MDYDAGQRSIDNWKPADVNVVHVTRVTESSVQSSQTMKGMRNGLPFLKVPERPSMTSERTLISIVRICTTYLRR